VHVHVHEALDVHSPCTEASENAKSERRHIPQPLKVVARHADVAVLDFHSDLLSLQKMAASHPSRRWRLGCDNVTFEALSMRC
jgi:hypothetical protein